MPFQPNANQLHKSGIEGRMDGEHLGSRWKNGAPRDRGTCSATSPQTSCQHGETGVIVSVHLPFGLCLTLLYSSPEIPKPYGNCLLNSSLDEEFVSLSC
jgi:hypothetical protein